MGQISLSIPQVGLANSTEDPKVANDFTAIQNVINGNLDATNISATLAQSAAVNQAGQTVKGAVSIATSESRTNTAYGTLTTPDQVTGIVLPTNGLIAVWYQATWQESVSGAAKAAIFLGTNQLRAAEQGSGSSPGTSFAEASIGAPAGINQNQPLASWPFGVFSGPGVGGSTYLGDVNTGQVVGVIASGGVFAGGPCNIFAVAGTYTVSVQFKASSGSVTASNRKLWVQALSFA